MVKYFGVSACARKVSDGALANNGNFRNRSFQVSNKLTDLSIYIGIMVWLLVGAVLGKRLQCGIVSENMCFSILLHLLCRILGLK